MSTCSLGAPEYLRAPSSFTNSVLPAQSFLSMEDNGTLTPVGCSFKEVFFWAALNKYKLLFIF